MTGDSTVICSAMEPMPELPMCWSGKEKSPLGWWVLVPIDGGGMAWRPEQLTLDRLHEVEKRLTDKQWQEYRDRLINDPEAISGYFEYGLIHASAEEKVRALASMFRRWGIGQ